jgi:hypothetical protein
MPICPKADIDMASTTNANNVERIEERMRIEIPFCPLILRVR